MTQPTVKKIALMASQDWSMRAAMREFLEFLDPVFRWQGKEYRIELTRVLSKPVRAGQDVSGEADLVVDRTTHWNPYYRSWAHQAANSLARMVNHPYTFFVYDKHSTFDLLARAMHPKDRFPTTVLLPLFHPWTRDQVDQYWWAYEQQLVAENTRFGFDPARRRTDMASVRRTLEHAKRRERRSALMRENFSGVSGNWIKKLVEEEFGDHWPLYLKKAYGGGGSKVWRVDSLQELYERYDETGGEEAYHLQEAIIPYDHFYRAMGIGPIVWPMYFQPDRPLHEHYSPEKPVMDRDVHFRLESYVLFVNSYHRWTYNSFETLFRGGQLHPIDFANACPDSNFTSLHVHFPLLICALTKWLSYCAIVGKDMRIDMEMTRYLKVLNDPGVGEQEKFDYCRKLSEEYFELDRFAEYCALNFEGLEERMVEFYDAKFDEVIRYAIERSDFPEHEHAHFFDYYKTMMERHFRKDPKRYLTPAVFA